MQQDFKFPIKSFSDKKNSMSKNQLNAQKQKHSDFVELMKVRQRILKISKILIKIQRQEYNIKIPPRK